MQGDIWDAVVNVSNVCWSPLLPPLGRRTPLWERLELILYAWHELHGRRTQLMLVADESLVRALDKVTEYRRLRDRGELATHPVADALILRLAQDHGLHVITRDHYVDHRLLHPWIEDSPERFHGWSTHNGRVQIEPLGIRRRSRQTVSVAVEAKHLKQGRLDPRNPQHRKILGTRWKCTNSLCLEAAQWQDQLLIWPVVGLHGTALCPSCKQPLLELGPRDPLCEAVVEHRGSHEEIVRFPLEVNNPVIVGRGTALKGINLVARHESLRPAVMQVSRQHLLLRIEETAGNKRRMVVIDLDSRNGTMVERWTGTAFQRPKPLAPNAQTILGGKDRLILGDAVNLRLSGKSYIACPKGSGVPALGGFSLTGPMIDRRR